MALVYYETPTTINLVASDTYLNRIPHSNIIGEVTAITVRDATTKQIIELLDWQNDPTYPNNGIVVNCSTDLSVIVGMTINQTALISPLPTPALTNLAGAVLIFFMLSCSVCFGQGYYTPITGNTMQRGSVAITRKGNTDTVHHTSAILELSAIDRGLLFTRITEAQMLAIAAPVAGLVIYNTDSADLFYHNGSQWVSFATGSGNLPSWLLSGNAGTNGGSNFIGTTDNHGLSFKTNNIGYAYIDSLQGQKYISHLSDGHTPTFYNGVKWPQFGGINGIGFDYFNPAVASHDHLHGFVWGGDYRGVGGNQAEINMGNYNDSTNDLAVFSAHYNGSGNYELSMECIGTAGTSKIFVQNTSGIAFNFGTPQYTFPSINATAGQTFVNDGSGNISWENITYLLSLVPSYASDSAAASGGLSIGDSYYNTTSHVYTRRTT